MITSDKTNGDVFCLIGESYETEFYDFILKGPGYKIMMMSTFLVLTMLEG